MAVKAEKEYKKFLREDTEERSTRRSRIFLRKTEEVKVEDPLRKSVDILEFFGNILHGKFHTKKEMSLEEILEYQGDPLMLAGIVRTDVRKLRNYIENFTTKSNILLKIFNSVCEKLKKFFDSSLMDYIGLKEELTSILSLVDINSELKDFENEKSELLDEDESKELVFESMEVVNEEEEKKKNQLKKLKGLLKEIISKLDISITEINKNIKKLTKGFNSKYITEKIFGFISETIQLKYDHFTINYYQVYKKYTYNQDLSNIITQNTSLFITEFKICCLIKLYQNLFDFFIGERMIKFVKDGNLIVENLKLFLTELVPKVNQLSGELFEDEVKDIDISFLELQAQECNLDGLLGCDLRKFVKKKIEMDKKHLLTNEDISDFFHIYKLMYSRENSIVLKFLSCNLLRKSNDGNKSVKRQPGFLVLDLTGGITLVYNFSGNDFDKKMSIIDYFNREIEEIRQSVKFFRYCANCSLHIDSQKKLIKVEFSIDQGVISQHLKSVVIAVEIDDLSEGIAFVKLFNNMKKLKTSSSENK